MIRTLRLLLTKSYWKSGFRFWSFVKGLMEGFGSVYLIVKISEWVAKSEMAALSAAFPKTAVVLVLAVVSGFGFFRVRPRRAVSCKLANRDVTLTIEVGDLFFGSDSLVIGTNRTFDVIVRDGLISPQSAQGQFSEKYYSQIEHLDADITRSLAGLQPTRRGVKTVGKTDEYALGTVAMVQPSKNKKRRRAYMVAIAELNDQGRAHGTIEGLRTSVSALWSFIAERGDIEPLRVPVLGTGYSRLTQQRSEIIKELLKSFIAACADRRFCESLTVVISYADYRKYDIDLDELGSYLTYLCKYTELRRPQETGAGAPLPDFLGVSPATSTTQIA